MMLLLTRMTFITSIIMSSTSCFQFLFPPQNNNNIISTQVDPPPLIAAYHEPPPQTSSNNNHDDDAITRTNDYYSNNPSVFGKILSGEIPARNYLESTELLAFRDRSPKAPLHALVIPKRYVKTVYSLRGNSNRSDDDDECDSESEKDHEDNDIHLIQNMRQMGLDILKQQQPEAFAIDDYILCFHIPPFNSVDHLHLHVLAPASEMNWLYREIKYKCGARWCTSDLDVIERLKAGLPAVSYTHPFHR